MKEPNSILIEQQPINNLYLNDTIDGPGILGPDDKKSQSIWQSYQRLQTYNIQ